MGDLVGRAILRSRGFESGLWAAKLGFICIGIVSTVILFKLAIFPYSLNFILSFLSAIPTFWLSIRTWLSPPYVYIILNFIIITIAASSSLHHPNHPNQTKTTHQPSKTQMSLHTHLNDSRSGENIWQETITEEEKGGDEDGEEQAENPSLSMDKNDDASDEISPKEEEATGTLEETWKMITEGKKKERTLKKSETWERPPRVVLKATADDEEEDKDPVAWAQRELRKSETFNDTRSSSRREKSMSQEELNQRVEAFIKNFNKQMRLQREESEQRSLEIANQGLNFSFL